MNGKYGWKITLFQIIHNMLMNEKETYEAPRVEILEVKSEGIICASKDVNPSNPFSNPEWNW